MWSWRPREPDRVLAVMFHTAPGGRGDLTILPGEEGCLDINGLHAESPAATRLDLTFLSMTEQLVASYSCDLGQNAPYHRAGFALLLHCGS